MGFSSDECGTRLIDPYVNQRLVKQELRRLAQSKGHVIRDDKVCLAGETECMELQEWAKSVSAALENIVRHSIHEATVAKRIYGLNRTGDAQAKDSSCWAANALLLKHYLQGSAVENADGQYHYTRIREKEEMLAMLHVPTEKQLYKALSVRVSENALPGWYTEIYEIPKTMQERQQTAAQINRTFQRLISRYRIKNADRELKTETLIQIMRELKGSFDDHAVAKFLGSVWEEDPDRERRSLEYYFYMAFDSPEDLPSDAFGVWFVLLGLSPWPVANPSFDIIGLGPECLNMDNLVYLLRRSPVVVSVDVLGFISTEEELEKILKDMDSPNFQKPKVRGGHAITVYDLFYDYAAREFKIRYINTSPGFPPELLDDYAYAVLGLEKSSIPKNSMTRVEFCVMSYKLFILAATFHYQYRVKFLNDYSGVFLAYSGEEGADNTDSYSC